MRATFIKPYCISQPNDILPFRGVVCDKSLQVRTNDKIKTEPESKSEEVIKKDISAPVKKTTVKEEADNTPEKKPLDKEVPTKAAKKTSAGNNFSSLDSSYKVGLIWS